MPELLRTPLYDWHVEHGGRMVEFGGWEMPVQYTSIVEEHHAVRTAAGLFDISHMGRLSFRGPSAGGFLQRLVTCRVDNLAVGQIRYGLVCRDDGGILDDILVYRHRDAFGLVVNASNREKIVSWAAYQIDKNQDIFHDCQLDDRTLESSMFALQGPRALDLLSTIAIAESQEQLRNLKYYWCMQPTLDMRGSRLMPLTSRTGYTGEDGFELSCALDIAEMLWQHILEVGQSLGLKPCGLGARDTLRLEAAMPLYGHELTEEIDPFTAGLDFAVKLDKPDFIGKAALEEIAKRTDRKKRIGLELAGKRIAREGSVVMQADHAVGTVTSGTFSPTLEKSIAMAYAEPAASAVGTPLEVDIRGKRESAVVVPLPFYKRPKKS